MPFRAQGNTHQYPTVATQSIIVRTGMVVMTRRPVALAQIALVDATVVATLIHDALEALDHGLQGWPETTPGASPISGNGSRECPHPDCTNSSPCLIHDPDGTVTLTPTERLGITTDIAARDLQALSEHIRRMAHHASQAARLVHQWGLQGVTDTAVKDGLKERLDEIWCRNCAKAGISTVHRIGRTECAFCESFRLTGACGLKNPNNYPAPKGLLDVHFSRRLDSSDVVRCMVAVYGFGWNRKASKKGRRTA